VSDAVEWIDKIIEGLQKIKEEMLLRNGKAYRCKKCGKIVVIDNPDAPHVKEKLCLSCWHEEEDKRLKEKWLELLKDAVIVDVEPDYECRSYLKRIVVVKNGKKYMIEPDPSFDEPEIIVLDENEYRVNVDA